MVDVMIGFAGTLLAKVLESLIVVTGRELQYVINYDNNIETLNKQVHMLKEKSQEINRKVEEARQNEETVVPEVDEWCTRVNIICDQYERFIKDEVPENKGILKGCFSNMKKLYILSKKAKKKTEEAATLKAVMLNKISYPSPPLGVGDTSRHFKKFESRSPTINKLMKLLKDETTQIISICGMGGSGKTTMVEEVIRCVEAEKLFDNITKARVSKEHDLAKVQEELADWLGLSFQTSGKDEYKNWRRAKELWKRLLKGKKGNLVVLDDVWKHIDLKNIGIPCGDEYKNCKVILTSRNEDVCQEIGCNPDHILILDALTQSETWSLMEEMVGDKLHEPDFCKTASEIAYKCGGLPIAIVCLGRALKNKKKEVWNDTLKKLQSSMVPANMEGVKEAVYKSLQVSYDLLEDEETKKTFLLCCLYPEYANIQLEGLVRCGVGLKFYQDVNLLIHARDRVHALTDKLISHSLSVLPEMTYLFTLSVALSLVRLESLHIEYCKNLQQVILNPWPSTSASTIENKIVFPKLTNLILNNVDSLTVFSQGINLQVEFPQLKVLKVEKLEKFETFCPDEINLTTDFQSLVNNKVEFSSLADLTITGLNIKEVWCGQSGDLSNQAELQGLYIQLCHKMEQVISTTMEEGIQFSKLKEIILFRMDRLALFCKGIDHLEFPQLRVLRLRSLTRFQTFCSKDTTGHLPDLFNDKFMFPSLETLEISELESVEVLWSCKLPSNHFGKLMYLKVDNCHKLLNIFPSDLQRIFPYLERLEVKNCDSLERVWGYKGVQIQNLKSVFVYGCPKLRNLCSFYTFKGFSNLEVVDISHCKMMEAVVEDEHSEKIVEVLSLNKLEEMKLENLTNLNYFCQTKCDMELIELNRVIVKSCLEMHAFSQSSVSTPKLEFALLDGQKRWSGDLNRTIRHWF